MISIQKSGAIRNHDVSYTWCTRYEKEPHAQYCKCNTYRIFKHWLPQLLLDVILFRFPGPEDCLSVHGVDKA